MKALLLASLLLAGPAGAKTKPKKKPAPARPAFAFSLVSVADGSLTSGGKAVLPGTALPSGGKFSLSGGTAVLRAGKAGLVLIKGPASFSPERGGLALKAGGALSVLPALTGRFAVTTRAVSAASGSASFYAEARGPETYLCVCEGRVEVSGTPRTAAFKTRVQSAKRHKAFRFVPSKTGILQTEAPFERHTDADIAALRPAPAKR